MSQSAKNGYLKIAQKGDPLGQQGGGGRIRERGRRVRALPPTKSVGDLLTKFEQQMFAEITDKTISNDHTSYSFFSAGFGAFSTVSAGAKQSFSELNWERPIDMCAY